MYFQTSENIIVSKVAVNMFCCKLKFFTVLLYTCWFVFHRWKSWLAYSLLTLFTFRYYSFLPQLELLLNLMSNIPTVMSVPIGGYPSPNLQSSLAVSWALIPCFRKSRATEQLAPWQGLLSGLLWHSRVNFDSVVMFCKTCVSYRKLSGGLYIYHLSLYFPGIPAQEDNYSLTTLAPVNSCFRQVALHY